MIRGQGSPGGSAAPGAPAAEGESEGARPGTAGGAEVLTLDDAALERAFGIKVGAIRPPEGGAPFHAAWAVVGPGETSRRHAHHEAERWLVVEGHGTLSSGARQSEVGPGDVVELPPFVDHSLHNPSPEHRLVFVSLWWQDLALASRLARAERASAPPPADAEGAARGAGPARPRRRVMVTATPPTPNGDLHLGHFSGPYVAADAHARYLRMAGAEARFVTGSDDFQSYVAGKALREGASPERVADHYAARIEGALRQAGVRCDLFTRSLAPAYVRRVQAIVRRLYDAGQIVAEECDYLVSPRDGRRLFEFYVAGACPHCRAPAGGGVCEECGRPNEGASLLEPAATLGGGPLVRERLRRLVVPLRRHEARLRALLDRMAMPTRLRALAEELLTEGAPDVPVTHPHHWGIRCPVPGFEGQVVSTWFEMGFNLLEGVRELERRDGTGAGPAAELVQFFGIDNGFYYALLYPLLASLVEPASEPPAALVCNEFYLLDGRKFSTSRAHAVWLRDFLAEEPADLVRFYLAHTRPESERSNFTVDDYRAFVARELRGAWQGWLRDLGRRVGERAGGLAPEPGSWTDEHRRHYARLGRIAERAREGYEARTFSLQAVTRELAELVRAARAFAGAERHWAGVGARQGELRTALALELAAARALAQHVAPLMPDFAQRLWAALGLPGEVEAQGFDEHLDWVPAGARVDLGGELFAARPATPRRDRPALGEATGPAPAP
ncbi:MAG TPA: class I tRNA ligase family protein [Polyangiaceae bacterium]|nr:class I tRNA ligase family protein [Polyangiaceae bacterium]